MSKNYKTGVGILDVIGIVLIVLKCLSLISLSWLWVLAPFWIQIVIGVVIGLGIVALRGHTFICSDELNERLAEQQVLNQAH